jgi:hypothetical protein
MLDMTVPEKRLIIAAMAMQGMLASPNIEHPERIPTAAVFYAEELLELLRKPMKVSRRKRPKQ